jgi:hypothetical protein
MSAPSFCAYIVSELLIHAMLLDFIQKMQGGETGVYIHI